MGFQERFRDDPLYAPTGRKCGSSRKLFGGFFENTHMHGLPHAANARNGLRTFFWAILFLIGLGFCAYHVALNFQKYFGRPLQTSVSERHSVVATFPAVTICNENPVLNSKLDLIGQGWKDFIKSGKTGQNISASLGEGMMVMREYFSFLYSQLSESDQQEAGHQLSTMLISCTYDGHSCSERDFISVTGTSYGNCYTFNSGANGQPVRFSKRAGSLYGLDLELDIQQEEYVKEISELGGLRVVIHNQTVHPFPVEEGFSATPGFATFTGIRKATYLRTTSPPVNCQNIDVQAEPRYNMWAKKNKHIGFSTLACQYTCYHQHLVDECSCGIKGKPSSSGGQEEDTIKSCLSEEEIRCVVRLDEEFAAGNLNCSEECPSMCEEVLFHTDSSHTLWPTSQAAPQVIERMKAASPSLRDDLNAITDPQQALAFVRENTVKLVVYFKNLDYTVYSTGPSYDLVAMLSDQGGQLGLWIGLSILSACELVELIWDLCKLGFFNCYKGTHHKKGNYEKSQPRLTNGSKDNDKEEEM